MVGLGMEGKRLKIVLHVKKVELTTWIHAIYEIFKGLHEKEENSRDVRFILMNMHSFGNFNPIWKKVHYEEKVLVYV